MKSACLAYSGALRAILTSQAVPGIARRTFSQQAEAYRRERISQQQAKDYMDETRSHLLLILRKLDTDGSMVSEMMKR